MSEDDKPRGEPAVKAKIPNAKNIRSPEFTPHGISAGRGSGLNRPKPSALTAKQARNRRIAMIAGMVVAALAISGGVYWWVNRPDPEIEVTGRFAAEPKVEIPTRIPPARTVKVTTPITGDGRAIAEGDSVWVQFAVYKWAADRDEENSRVKSSNEKVMSTWERQAPQGGSTPSRLVMGDSGLTEVDKGLIGKTVGSRVLLQLPPSEELSKLDPQKITDKDSVVFVMDVQAAVPKDAQPQGAEQKPDDKALPAVEDKGAKEPKITVPDRDAPKELQAKTLVEGTGPALAKGDDAVVNYVGKIWKSGEVFDSSWKNEAPAMFPIGAGATIPGFDKGLTGVKVGSRVMLVLPPKEGYGEEGSPPTIKGDDTLVFVVDVLAKIQK